MDFKMEGSWNTENYCWLPWLAEKTNFWILDALMAKIVTFWPWWKPFNGFWFETLSFFPLFPFFLFATQKGVCVCVEGGGVGGCVGGGREKHDPPATWCRRPWTIFWIRAWIIIILLFCKFYLENLFSFSNFSISRSKTRAFIGSEAWFFSVGNIRIGREGLRFLLSTQNSAREDRVLTKAFPSPHLSLIKFLDSQTDQPESLFCSD